MMNTKGGIVTDINTMEVNVFKALAHPIRLKIVKNLRDKVYCVCEMNEDVEFSQSNLSQHLRVLRDAGIVISKKEGLRINYYIKNPDIFKVVDAVEEIVTIQIKALSKSLDD